MYPKKEKTREAALTRHRVKPPPIEVVLTLSVLLNIQNLLAVVKAANLANAMVLYICVACGVGTLVHTGHGELAVIGASFVSTSFRYFLLWYCHVYTSSCVNLYGFTS